MSTPTRQETLDALTIEFDRTRAMFESFTPAAWDTVVYAGPPTWTTRHLLIHLIDAESQFILILNHFKRTGEGAPADSNVDVHNSEAVPRLYEQWRAVSIADLIKQYHGVRHTLITVAETLTDEQLTAQLRHPLLGMMSATDFLRVVVLHVKVHGKDIKKAVAG